MPDVTIRIGNEVFNARFREQLAPSTCAAFKALLPWREELIHARWSGEACWIPLGSLDLRVAHENATSQPCPGDFIFYPGGISETEILLAYGPTSFACKTGPLAGNPFLSITSGLDRLALLGPEILRSGARPITFELTRAD